MTQQSYGRSLRLISILLILAFCGEQILYAAPDLKPAKFDLRDERISLPFSFPESVALVEDSYRAGHSPAQKVVYLIQDAHTNESGQLNLAKSLDILLTNEKNLKYIFTEAAVGDNSLSFLRPYRSLAERKQLARAYIRKGLLHGAEYLDLTSDHHSVLWGVENPELYIKSLEDYKQVVKERQRFDSYVKKINSTLASLKNRLLNPSLLGFDTDLQKYQKEEISLTDYFNVLMRESTLLAISLGDFPHLKNLQILKDKEAQINFKKANEEQLKAVQSLSFEEQKELKELADADANSPFKLSSKDQKGPRAFYTLLEEKLLLTQSRAGYSELFKYFDYLKTAKLVEAKNVLTEIKALEKNILDSYSKTEDERTLIRCSQISRYLEKLFHLTLTPEEFKEYKKLTEGDFGIEHLTGFLNKKIMDLKTYYDRSLFLEPGYQDMVKRSEDFYELTTRRDDTFIDQMLKKMSADSQTKAVLVTGGFHTTNLKALLKEKGISFVSITPQVLKKTNIKLYEELLLNQKMINAGPTKSVSLVSSTVMIGHPLTASIPSPVGSRLALQDIAGEQGAKVLQDRLDSPLIPDYRLQTTEKGARLAEKALQNSSRVVDMTNEDATFTPSGDPIVLIAEDDPSDRRLYVKMLSARPENMQIVLTETLQTALKALKIASNSGYLKFVITDGDYPYFSGSKTPDRLEVTDDMLETRPGDTLYSLATKQGIPVFYISGGRNKPDSISPDHFINKLDKGAGTVRNVLGPKIDKIFDNPATGARLAGETKRIYFFGAGQTEGRGDMKAILGGKGAGLAKMANHGIAVPPGFTITTAEAKKYLKDGKNQFPEGLQEEIDRSLARLENVLGRKFGDPNNPLLVSVRSGAAESMPGMMDTILNVGLNDVVVQSLAVQRNPRFAYDSYRRLLQMYGETAMDVKKAKLTAVLENRKHLKGLKPDEDIKLTAEDFQAMIPDLKAVIRQETGRDFPQDVNEQLRGAIEAVFRSSNNEQAITYRRLKGFPPDMVSAVNVQGMVFGNLNDNSGTAVAFTRDTATGENRFNGEYLTNAQGEDVVAGIRKGSPVELLKDSAPQIYDEIIRTAGFLEKDARDAQDIEFTVENGKLWLLQTRNAKRTAAAMVRMAVEMAQEGLISKEEAIQRVDLNRIEKELMHPMVDPIAAKKAIGLAKGVDASPGAAVGRIVFHSQDAEAWQQRGEKVILVRLETAPEDLSGMIVSQGILTARGGSTSHAALVARGQGIPAVVGVNALDINPDEKIMHVGDHVLREGDWITIDGSTGNVYEGVVATMESEIERVQNGTMRAEDSIIYQNYLTLLNWADGIRRLEVWANADTPADAKKARALGAQGIGLARTEHMFAKSDRVPAVQTMFLSKEGSAERERILLEIGQMQQGDFEGILEEMHGLPVTIRLLDPPMHEFLPKTEDMERIRDIASRLQITEAEVIQRIKKSHEDNPMLGSRGVRLLIMNPSILRMQTRAIVQAYANLLKRGIKTPLKIMIPNISRVEEVTTAQKIISEVVKEVLDAEKVAEVDRDIAIGVMIETPSAALTADKIAPETDFFSFGTNDLTQGTYMMSRDDAAKSFLTFYLEKGIFKHDPTQKLDAEAVLELIRIAVARGRSVKPDLLIGICGEHGGEPSSIALFDDAGLDYVSASPLRLPIARLAAAQSTLNQKANQKTKVTFGARLADNSTVISRKRLQWLSNFIKNDRTENIVGLLVYGDVAEGTATELSPVNYFLIKKKQNNMLGLSPAEAEEEFYFREKLVEATHGQFRSEGPLPSLILESKADGPERMGSGAFQVFLSIFMIATRLKGVKHYNPQNPGKDVVGKWVVIARNDTTENELTEKIQLELHKLLRDFGKDTGQISGARLTTNELRLAEDAMLRELEATYLSQGVNRDDYNIEPIMARDSVGTQNSEGRPIGTLKDGDIVVLTNHRNDRILSAAEALYDPQGFSAKANRFAAGVKPGRVVPFAKYDPKKFDQLGVREAFPFAVPSYTTLSDVLVANDVIQARIAESDKGAHVTNFFDGRKDIDFAALGIRTAIIPSSTKKDAQKPAEMKSREIADATLKFIEDFKDDPRRKFAFVNFATDIQGHVVEADRERAKRAVLATDEAVGRIREAVHAAGGVLIVTSDHGNIEEMAVLNDQGQARRDKYGVIPSKQHSVTNPVPFIVEGLGNVKLRQGQGLAGIAPTVLDIMGLEKPATMTGSLLENFQRKKINGPVIVIVRDGWGWNRFRDPQTDTWTSAEAAYWDATAFSKPPVDADLRKKNPWTLLKAHGDAVGLPEYQMGDSDNGHLTTGAGFAVPTLYDRIIKDIDSGAFDDNEVLKDAILEAMRTHRNIHPFGLVSDGGVHSDHRYILAFMKMAKKLGIDETDSRIFVHAILDGRDRQTRIDDQSGLHYLRQLRAKANEIGLKNFAVADVIGRHFGMDRDARNREKGENPDLVTSKKLWNLRFDVAYEAWTKGQTLRKTDVSPLLADFRERNRAFLESAGLYQDFPVTGIPNTFVQGEAFDAASLDAVLIPLIRSVKNPKLELVNEDGETMFVISGRIDEARFKKDSEGMFVDRNMEAARRIIDDRWFATLKVDSEKTKVSLVLTEALKPLEMKNFEGARLAVPKLGPTRPDLESIYKQQVEDSTPDYVKNNKLFDITDNGEITVTLKHEHLLPYHEKTNPEGLGLWAWLDDYEKEAKVATAGIRLNQNILYPWDTRFRISLVGVALATLGKALVAKERYGNAPLQKLAGGEVRYNTKQYVEMIARLQAAQGITTYIPSNNQTIPVWMASFITFVYDLLGAEYATSSHANSSFFATKDINDEGGQYLPEESLAFVAKIREVFNTVERNGRYEFKIASVNDSRVNQDFMKLLQDGTKLYTEYLRNGVATDVNLNRIRDVRKKFVIDNVGGSLHRTVAPIFDALGISRSFEWLRTEQDPYFHGIGKEYVNGKYRDLSQDTTIVIRDSKTGEVKSIPVMERMGYDTLLKDKPIGTIILMADPDGDRLVTGQLELADRADFLRNIGVDFLQLDDRRILALYTPNQSFFLTMVYQAQSLKEAGIWDEHPRFIIMTTASSTAWREWAEKNGINVLNVPVGFKEIAAMERKIEAQIKENPGKTVVVRDVFGREVNLGIQPRMLFAGEESGGAIIGPPQDLIRSKSGRIAVGMREKSDGEMLVIQAAMGGYLDQRGLLLSDYLSEIFEQNDIQGRYDVREDVVYYNQSEANPDKLKADKAEGEARRTKNYVFYLSMVLAYQDKQISREQIIGILNDIFEKDGFNFGDLKEIYFVGDGVFLEFPTKVLEIRPSGTDAKSKSYGMGFNKMEVAKYAIAIGNYDGTITPLHASFVPKKYSRPDNQQAVVDELAWERYQKYYREGLPSKTYTPPTVSAYELAQREAGARLADGTGADDERDTYEHLTPEQKARISRNEIVSHWNMRAERPDVLAVETTRYSLHENRQASLKLQGDIHKFLGKLINGKRVFEVGVGIGRMTSELARQAESVVGNDISPKMIERARQNLKRFNNVTLHLGKITDINLRPKSFDLVFDCLVLLHILNPEELRQTVERMKYLSDRILIVENTYQEPDTSSKFSIRRKVEDYEKLMLPYRLVGKKTHLYINDVLTMMLFENPKISTGTHFLENRSGGQSHLLPSQTANQSSGARLASEIMNLSDVDKAINTAKQFIYTSYAYNKRPAVSVYGVSPKTRAEWERLASQIGVNDINYIRMPESVSTILNLNPQSGETPDKFIRLVETFLRTQYSDRLFEVKEMKQDEHGNLAITITGPKVMDAAHAINVINGFIGLSFAKNQHLQKNQSINFWGVSSQAFRSWIGLGGTRRVYTNGATAVLGLRNGSQAQHEQLIKDFIKTNYENSRFVIDTFREGDDLHLVILPPAGARLALPTVNPTSTEAWQKLQEDFVKMQAQHLRGLFKSDPQRAKRFNEEFKSNGAEIFVDYSKNLVDGKTLQHLFELARQTGLADAIQQMFSGEKINQTENRAVLHTALRAPRNKKVLVTSNELWNLRYKVVNVIPDVHAVLDHMKQFSEAINSGNWKGYTGKPITDIVNIGIGGSDLGPVMVTEALKPYATGKVNVHFVSNIDGTDITEKVIKKLNPETTLFIVASKTFTTQETMTNAETAKKWFLDETARFQFNKPATWFHWLKLFVGRSWGHKASEVANRAKEEAIKKHFVAISTDKAEVEKFGIDAANMFEFWDWVGGRYSLWSAIGLSIATYIGFDNFQELLAGANAMDEHFEKTAFEHNIPVILGLLSIWYTNFYHAETHAILPYDQYLHRLPAYLQQAFMESNGKSVDRSGKAFDYVGSPIIFGEAGTNGQHSFYQLFHQGNQLVPADFIGISKSHNPLGDHHKKLLANFFAQTQALAFGKTLKEVLHDRVDPTLAPHRVFKGNKPTTSILINQLTPRALGALVAMYEHQIFVEGAVLNLFSFDQFGVELGKVKAGPIFRDLKSGSSITTHDASTARLIEQYLKQKSGARLAEQNLTPFERMVKEANQHAELVNAYRFGYLKEMPQSSWFALTEKIRLALPHIDHARLEAGENLPELLYDQMKGQITLANIKDALTYLLMLNLDLQPKEATFNIKRLGFLDKTDPLRVVLKDKDVDIERSVLVYHNLNPGLMTILPELQTLQYIPGDSPEKDMLYYAIENQRPSFAFPDGSTYMVVDVQRSGEKGYFLTGQAINETDRPETIKVEVKELRSAGARLAEEKTVDRSQQSVVRPQTTEKGARLAKQDLTPFQRMLQEANLYATLVNAYRLGELKEMPQASAFALTQKVALALLKIDSKHLKAEERLYKVLYDQMNGEISILDIRKAIRYLKILRLRTESEKASVHQLTQPTFNIKRFESLGKDDWLRVTFGHEDPKRLAIVYFNLNSSRVKILPKLQTLQYIPGDSPEKDVLFYATENGRPGFSLPDGRSYVVVDIERSVKKGYVLTGQATNEIDQPRTVQVEVNELRSAGARLATIKQVKQLHIVHHQITHKFEEKVRLWVDDLKKRGRLNPDLEVNFHQASYLNSRDAYWVSRVPKDRAPDVIIADKFFAESLVNDGRPQGWEHAAIVINYSNLSSKERYESWRQQWKIAGYHNLPPGNEDWLLANLEIAVFGHAYSHQERVVRNELEEANIYTLYDGPLNNHTIHTLIKFRDYFPQTWAALIYYLSKQAREKGANALYIDPNISYSQIRDYFNLENPERFISPAMNGQTLDFNFPAGARLATSDPLAGIPEAVKALANVDLRGERVIVEVNMNVPHTKDHHLDTDLTRINLMEPVARWLLDKGATPIFIGHIGRYNPDPKQDDRESAQEVAAELGRRFPNKVFFHEGSVNNEVGINISYDDIKDGEINVVENLRFAQDFEQGDSAHQQKFAQDLLALARRPVSTGDQISGRVRLVFDAFGDVNSFGASKQVLLKLVDEVYTGPAMVEEFKLLREKMNMPLDALIFGGAKSQKIEALRHLLTRLKPGGFVLVGAWLSHELNGPQHHVLVELRNGDPNRILTATGYKLGPNGEKWDIDDQTRARYEVKLRALNPNQVVMANGTMGYDKMPGFDAGTNAILDVLKEKAQEGVGVIVVGGDGSRTAKKRDLHLLSNTTFFSGSTVPFDYAAKRPLKVIEVMRRASGARLASEPRLTLETDLRRSYSSRVRGSNNLLSRLSASEFVAIQPNQLDQPERNVAQQVLMDLAPFFESVALAHAAEFSSPDDVKDIRVLMDEKTLRGAGLRFNKTTGEITGTELYSGKPLNIQVKNVKTRKDDSIKGELSPSDLLMIRRQKRLTRKNMLDGMVTTAETAKRSLVSADTALIGRIGIDPGFDIFAADALEDSQGDPNVRFRVNTDNALIQAQAHARLVQLETQLNLKAGMLTSLFDLTGFVPEAEVYIMSPESEPMVGQRNLVVEREGLMSFKTDLAKALSRVAEDRLTDDRLVNAIRTDINPSVQFDKATFIQVVLGKTTQAIRKLYALLPELKAEDWNVVFRLANNVLRSVGRAA